MADIHTLSAAEVATLSNGVIAENKATDAFHELISSGLADLLEAEGVDGYRLTKAGLEVSLELQAALAQRKPQ